MSLIPDNWLPAVKMDRIICHWTAGRYNVSELDRDHYHFIIDGEGKVHRGYRSIRDNRPGSPARPAYHTWRLNTNSIGVAVACMAGATERNFGQYPLKKIQWETMAELVSELCDFYEIEPTERNVLQHGDVTRVYGPAYDQLGKWDVNALPWDRSLSYREVGDLFRQMVRDRLEDPEYHPDRVELIVNDKSLGFGQIVNGKTLVPVRAIGEAFGAKVDWEPGKNPKVRISTKK